MFWKEGTMDAFDALERAERMIADSLFKFIFDSDLANAMLESMEHLPLVSDCGDGEDSL
jgi:hypothetical protein